MVQKKESCSETGQQPLQKLRKQGKTCNSSQAVPQKQIQRKNPIMLIFCLMFTLIFLIIELLVVILKMSSAKTNYERANEMKESIGESRMKRIKEKDPLHFKTSSVHPEVMRLNEFLRKGAPKLF